MQQCDHGRDIEFFKDLLSARGLKLKEDSRLELSLRWLRYLWHLSSVYR